MHHNTFSRTVHLHLWLSIIPEWRMASWELSEAWVTRRFCFLLCLHHVLLQIAIAKQLYESEVSSDCIPSIISLVCFPAQSLCKKLHLRLSPQAVHGCIGTEWEHCTCGYLYLQVAFGKHLYLFGVLKGFTGSKDALVSPVKGHSFLSVPPLGLTWLTWLAQSQCGLLWWYWWLKYSHMPCKDVVVNSGHVRRWSLKTDHLSVTVISLDEGTRWEPNPSCMNAWLGMSPGHFLLCYHCP